MREIYCYALGKIKPTKHCLVKTYYGSKDWNDNKYCITKEGLPCMSMRTKCFLVSCEDCEDKFRCEFEVLCEN